MVRKEGAKVLRELGQRVRTMTRLASPNVLAEVHHTRSSSCNGPLGARPATPGSGMAAMPPKGTKTTIPSPEHAFVVNIGADGVLASSSSVPGSTLRLRRQRTPGRSSRRRRGRPGCRRSSRAGSAPPPPSSSSSCRRARRELPSAPCRGSGCRDAILFLKPDDRRRRELLRRTASPSPRVPPAGILLSSPPHLVWRRRR
ncbi:hypothetical protein BRADI_3g13743v3 [Brachypodium distachyon]|uniref:Uncharacterized protein n=1 Tax=Brachypodium distachyon TaxID=15368 RepID=A0A2K2CWY0_BRADI|nr:hypothetical protein BRADI_3g13743v3 [Brachypodium distachyon]